jgi:transcription antitermination protein NusB
MKIFMYIHQRHAARVVALQALYEIDAVSHAVAAVMPARLEEQPLNDDLREFAYWLVNGVLANKTQLDSLISENAPEFPLKDLAYIDRNVLRMALYEFFLTDATPAKAAINEAVELAKTYGSDGSGRFVNGVLGTLMQAKAPSDTGQQA